MTDARDIDCPKCAKSGDDCGEHSPSWEELVDYWKNEAASLRKQLEDARSEGWSGLRTYGKHRTDCRLYANSTLDCTCGLTDAIRALKGKS